MESGNVSFLLFIFAFTNNFPFVKRKFDKIYIKWRIILKSRYLIEDNVLL